VRRLWCGRVKRRKRTGGKCQKDQQHHAESHDARIACLAPRAMNLSSVSLAM
jgi:hypothetical protein